MKKLLCLLLALLMTASILLVACGDKDKGGENTDDDILFPSASSSETTTEPETTEPATYEFTDVDETVYVKNCLKVNIRSTPSWASNDNIVGSLEFGDERTYKRVKYNSVWSGIEIDGEICYVRLNEELDAPVGEPVTLFSASSCPWADPWKDNLYVTDGPFLYRSKTGGLFLIWSSFIKGNYAEMVVRFKNGKFGLALDHMEPLLDSDGGHGMIFSDGEHTYFTYHAPNTSLQERPEFCPLEDLGDRISIRK